MPYQVVVVAFTSASVGERNQFEIFFSQELEPLKAPDNLNFTQLTNTAINVTWTPLSLKEARGFPQYRVTLVQSLPGSRSTRQAMPVTTNNSFYVFRNLDENGMYSATVGVGTGGTTNFMDAPALSRMYSVVSSNILNEKLVCVKGAKLFSLNLQ